MIFEGHRKKWGGWGSRWDSFTLLWLEGDVDCKHTEWQNWLQPVSLPVDQSRSGLCLFNQLWPRTMGELGFSKTKNWMFSRGLPEITRCTGWVWWVTCASIGVGRGSMWIFNWETRWIFRKLCSAPESMSAWKSKVSWAKQISACNMSLRVWSAH